MFFRIINFRCKYFYTKIILILLKKFYPLKKIKIIFSSLKNLAHNKNLNINSKECLVIESNELPSKILNTAFIAWPWS
jgi:hypothetical protein